MYNKNALLNELSFKAVRSSGAGGQHVNKVSSKVELIFNLKASLFFNEQRKQRLINKLQNKLTKEGLLILKCDESRSQHKNKEAVIKRFFKILDQALIIPKRRIATKIPRAVIRKRLKNKKNLSNKKLNRKKPSID